MKGGYCTNYRATHKKLKIVLIKEKISLRNLDQDFDDDKFFCHYCKASIFDNQ